MDVTKERCRILPPKVTCWDNRNRPESFCRPATTTAGKRRTRDARWAIYFQCTPPTNGRHCLCGNSTFLIFIFSFCHSSLVARLQTPTTTRMPFRRTTRRGGGYLVGERKNGWIKNQLCTQHGFRRVIFGFKSADACYDDDDDDDDVILLPAVRQRVLFVFKKKKEKTGVGVYVKTKQNVRFG